MLKDIWVRLHETIGLFREGYPGWEAAILREGFGGGVCPCGPSCTCENCQCAGCGC